MRAIDRDRHDTWYLRPKTCARLWSGRVGRDKGGEGWIERRMKRERERFIEECGVESSRRKRGLERKVEGVEISRAEEKRLLHWSRSLPLLDLPQNTSLLLGYTSGGGGQCLQPCDGGAVQLGFCARYDARRPDGWLCSTARRHLYALVDLHGWTVMGSSWTSLSLIYDIPRMKWQASFAKVSAQTLSCS